MTKYRKSFYGATAIVVNIATYLFVIAIVLSFFYFFKFQITLVMQEQYYWNKIQEVPLDLFSISLDGELFVHRLNKIHYLGSDAEKEQLRDAIDNNITKQLFYSFGETKYPLEAVIDVAGIKSKYSLEGCVIEERDCQDYVGTDFVVTTRCHCYCSEDCGANADKRLTSFTKTEQGTCEIFFDISECLYTTGIEKHYKAEFPFPLTFNGTDKFTDVMSYEIIETK